MVKKLILMFYLLMVTTLVQSMNNNSENLDDFLTGFNRKSCDESVSKIIERLTQEKEFVVNESVGFLREQVTSTKAFFDNYHAELPGLKDKYRDWYERLSENSGRYIIYHERTEAKNEIGYSYWGLIKDEFTITGQKGYIAFSTHNPANNSLGRLPNELSSWGQNRIIYHKSSDDEIHQIGYMGNVKKELISSSYNKTAFISLAGIAVLGVACWKWLR